jgi:hypothetical protein
MGASHEIGSSRKIHNPCRDGVKGIQEIFCFHLMIEAIAISDSFNLIILFGSWRLLPEAVGACHL